MDMVPVGADLFQREVGKIARKNFSEAQNRMKRALQIMGDD